MIDDNDDYGVWERLCGGQCPADFAELATRYWQVQSVYNRKASRKCPGIMGMRPRRNKVFKNFCNSILCPACWARTQLEIMKTAESITSPWWHVRETNELETGQVFDPRVLTRFKSHSSVFKTVGWCISCELAGGYEPTGTGGTTYRSPTMVYRYIGIFTSETPIRPYATGVTVSGERVDGVVRGESGEWIGRVTSTSYDSVSGVLAGWEESTPHPASLIELPDLRRHEEFIRTLGRKHYTVNLNPRAAKPRCKKQMSPS